MYADPPPSRTVELHVCSHCLLPIRPCTCVDPACLGWIHLDEEKLPVLHRAEL